MNKVLVVHCVDTEGPIGGDVRRNPDGSAEFFDNWDDILASLRELTDMKFRYAARDSFGGPYRFNWFLMDFMGFRTNPKNRIQRYNDTYDNIKSLNTAFDSFHWHYHHPPASGVGDQWSDDWDSSDEYLNILGHRLLDRHDFPAAFRAGGTIEDEKCSRWLEDHFMVDYSNRCVRNAVAPTTLFDFSWHGAPADWGVYHPSHDDLFAPGHMKRYVVRSIDAKSRFHTLDLDDVDEAFESCAVEKRDIILSYFSHDHRDMREETRSAISLITRCSQRSKIPFKWCDAVEAVRIADHIDDVSLDIKIVKTKKRQRSIDVHGEMFQRVPFCFARGVEGDISCPEIRRTRERKLEFDVPIHADKIGIVAHSLSGRVAFDVEDIR